MTEEKNNSDDVVLRDLLGYNTAGLSLIPIADGKKIPHQILGSKHDLLKHRSMPDEVRK